MASLFSRALKRRAYRIEGRVLDEEGRPVAAAHVRLRPEDQTATTGPDGTFAFGTLAPRRYLLSASKDDLYAGPTIVRVGEANESVILRMHHAATIVVHVVADRKPVAGAKLFLLESVHVDSYYVEFPMPPVETDLNGTVRVRGLPPGTYRGWVTAPTPEWSQESLQVSCRDRGGTAEYVATLQPGATIEGVVRGPFLRPVRGVTIRLWPSTMGTSSFQAASDEDGRWQLVVSAGTYRVHAGSERYRALNEIVIDCDGRTPQRDVVIRVGFGSLGRAVASMLPLERWSKTLKDRRIAGIVVDEHGNAAEEANVVATAATDNASGRTMQVVTDSNGRFEFEARDDYDYDVKASWPTIRDSEHGVVQRVRPGDVRVRLVLPVGATLSGRVLSEGRPLQHFGVTLQTEKFSPFGGWPIGVRSADGHFMLRNVDPGTWRFTVVGPGTRHKVIDGITAEAGKTLNLGDIVMERGDRVSGHVRDQAGAPVSGARVMIGRHLNDENSQLEQWLHGEYVTTTNGSGEFLFGGIDTHSPHFATPLIVATHYSAGASLLRELPEGDGTIDLVLLGSGSIAGVVEGIEGRHISVLAKRPDEPPSRRRAPVWNGRFRFEDVPPGDYEVALDLPPSEQLSSTKISVVANETAHPTLRLTTSTVRLKVNIQGKRASDGDYHVELDPPPLDRNTKSMRMRNMTTGDEMHTFTFDYVKPGSYRISVDGKKTWKDVTVDASPAEQTIELSLS